MTSTQTAPTDSPSTPTTFESLGISRPTLDAIAAMGWDDPTPVQAESFAPAVAGEDLMVQARTGTGKTGAFGIPIVDRLVDPKPYVQALILAPTRELALQSAREIEKLAQHQDMHTVAIYGGAPMDKQIRALERGAQIVCGTPGRVLDHLRRGTLDVSGLRVFVLDEADEMLSMGFAKELNAIMERLPEQRQTLLYSATIDRPVQRIAERHMHEPRFVTLSGDAVGALGVSHFIYLVSGLARSRDLVQILEIEDPESAIVFCNTKAETQQVAHALQQAGFNADWLNGDLPQGEREKVMARTRKGAIRYLVATDVAARGIDISHLTHVVNFSLPEHIEQYVHRTGRTGRAGRTGTALTLVSPQDLGRLYYLRLQYKIFPVERSLPSAGAAQTRIETDRIAMLEAAFPERPSEMELAVARRLLTHPDAERLLGGLLDSFFGLHGTSEEVTEEAAAVRRTRGAPAEVAERETETDDIEETPDDADIADDAEDEPGGAAEAGAAGLEAGDAAEASPAPDAEAWETLYVNLGRKDGVRVPTLRDLVVERADVDADAVRKIRVRERHAFVEVAPGLADALIEALDGTEYQERALVVERARPR